MTGASAGIGFELAGVFARNGYDVVMTAEDDDVYAAAHRDNLLWAWDET